MTIVVDVASRAAAVVCGAAAFNAATAAIVADDIDAGMDHAVDAGHVGAAPAADAVN